MFGFIISACLTGLNVALYADGGNPWNLGAAVICGACTLFCLAMAVFE